MTTEHSSSMQQELDEAKARYKGYCRELRALGAKRDGLQDLVDLYNAALKRYQGCSNDFRIAVLDRVYDLERAVNKVCGEIERVQSCQDNVGHWILYRELEQDIEYGITE